jgi:SAM-dependent methyltransferase
MLREIKSTAQSIVTMGRRRPQNFLGARWVATMVDHSPQFIRENIALRMLALSPHYFYRNKSQHARFNEFLRAERDRNRKSRQIIVEKVLQPYFSSHFTALDYGCGPGFMARASSRFVQKVIACDISEGVLACARVLNPGPNIRYVNIASEDYERLADGSIDVAYSFAVIQHVRDRVLAGVLRRMLQLIRPNGKLLFHVALHGPGWRTEAEWDADRSVRGRVKANYGLNCFGRDPAMLRKMVLSAGFTDPTIESLGELALLTDDDVSRQHLLVATRPAGSEPAPERQSSNPR